MLNYIRTGWGRGENIRNVAVDDLRKTDVAVVRHQIEALGLDTGRLHGRPLQVIAGKFGKRSLFGFFGHRLDRRRAVDGLLSAGDVGQPRSAGDRQMVSWCWYCDGVAGWTMKAQQKGKGLDRLTVASPN